jgi:hypothetical protein
MKVLTNPQRRKLMLDFIRYQSREGQEGLLVNNNRCLIVKHSPELKALLKKKLVKQVRCSGLGRKRETYLVPEDGVARELPPSCPECGKSHAWRLVGMLNPAGILCPNK